MSMKCQAKPAKDPATGKTAKACGYESMVAIGGGMLSESITGYCRACKKFVGLHWTAKNLPAALKARVKVKPHPVPLGEVWDAATGKIMTIHACPKCKGPFLEIKKFDELKHCPVCNKPHFAVDKSKPRLAID
jgi:Zn finger protein HypA/HybF involved in hydrogenase expression